MSTRKVLKNSQPQQVKIREGSKDARRPSVRTRSLSEPVPVEVPVQRKVKVEPTKATKPGKAIKTTKTPVPVAAVVMVPASIAKKPRAKAKPPVQETAAAVDSSSKPTVTTPAAVTRAPVPENELWETDSPVMHRISLLRTRNAQLSAQIQRLQKRA